MKLNLIKTIALSLALTSLSSIAAFAEGPIDPGQANADESVLEKAIDDALSAEKPSKPSLDKASNQPSAESKQADPAKRQNLADERKPEPKMKAKTEPKKYNKLVTIPQDDKVQVKMVERKPTKPTKSKKITAEEAAFLQSVDSVNKKGEVEFAKAQDNKKNAAYVPAPVESQESKHEGFLVERDSTKIIKKRLSYMDTLDVKVCFSAGVSIVFDEDIHTELQHALIDDKIFFDAIDFENHRGVYVRLKQPIPDGKYWESAIRLVRKDNDKAYLVNLLGVPCPKLGTSPFPKVIYIKDKFPGITGKNSKLMTPEDTIIELSSGLPRKNVNKITVHDMMARSTSDWTIFGIQVQLPEGSSVKPDKLMTIKVLDNLQINEIPAKVEFLPLQSEKATSSSGQATARFKALINIDKQYFTEQRYLYLMFVDKNNGYYQYIRVDTLPYVISLKERGFDI